MFNNLENIVTIISIAGSVGSTSALIVDFGRRLIRSKAKDHADQLQFQRIVTAVDVLQHTLDDHAKKSAEQHIDLCQRVSMLEGAILQ